MYVYIYIYIIICIYIYIIIYYYILLYIIIYQLRPLCLSLAVSFALSLSLWSDENDGKTPKIKLFKDQDGNLRGDGSDFGTLRDQICTTQRRKNDSVSQVDFP